MLHEGAYAERTAQQILADFRDGTLDGESRMRVLADGPVQPLRKFLHEIVWTAYRDANPGAQEEDSDRRFKPAFEHAPIGMALSDLTGRIIHANEALCQLLGYRFEELVGQSVGMISTTEDRQREIDLGQQLLSGEIPRFQLEKRFLHKEGHRVTTWMSVSLVRDGNGTPSEVLAHVVDLTEYRLLEQHAQAAEKLEGLGTLAGGIAHDFGSLLTVIQGASESLTNPSGDVDEEALRAIQASVDSASRLTKQLLAFSRSGAVEVTRFPLDPHIEKMRDVFTALLGTGVDLRLDLQCPDTFVRMSAQQLEQVLINLVANAGHAMQNGGLLHIRTRPDPTRAERIELSIEDSGKGMDDATLARAFEPFFTTRAAQGGTGLGLSTVYGIVQRFGGDVELHSALDQGTSIHIHWPVDDTRDEASSTVQEKTTAPSKALHVLVVDDQPLVCKAVRRILEPQGYRVSTVHGVMEARAFFSEAHRIDCVLTDIMLQDGSGTELVDLARARWPSLPFLYMSGYTAAHLSQEHVLVEPGLLLQKPFSPAQLCEHIQAVLRD